MEDLISVIVPVYRVEKYIIDCVRSIIHQTYTNLQIILVDDGSDDNCPRICDKFALDDRRIEVIHKKNGGLSSARNAGIERAYGAWILFVDSDDFIAVNMIEKLADIVDKTGADIAVCDYEQIPEGRKFDIIRREEVDEVKVLGTFDAEARFYEPGRMGQCMVAWNKLYRKNLFDKEGIPVRYPVGKIFEDGFTTYKLVYNASKVAFTDEVLYFYRQRGDSIMSRNGGRNYAAAQEAGIGKLDFFRGRGEMELFKMQLNSEIHNCIHFYEAASEKEDKHHIRQWFKVLYWDYFRNEKWPFGKRVRMRAFELGYLPYKIVSSFEGLYNRL